MQNFKHNCFSFTRLKFIRGLDSLAPFNFLNMARIYHEKLGFVELTEEIKSLIKSKDTADDIITEITNEQDLPDPKRTRKSKPTNKLAV